MEASFVNEPKAAPSCPRVSTLSLVAFHKHNLHPTSILELCIQYVTLLHMFLPYPFHALHKPRSPWMGGMTSLIKGGPRLAVNSLWHFGMTFSFVSLCSYCRAISQLLCSINSGYQRYFVTNRIWMFSNCPSP